MEKIIHICGILILSLLWGQEVNAHLPHPWENKDVPWGREEKQDSPELSQQGGEPHENGHISSGNQEEAE